MSDEQRSDGAWFAPKRYGYGAGLPIAWQGWAVLAAYCLGLTALHVLAVRFGGLAVAGAFAVSLLATVWLIVVARKRTRGGWRWRSGKDAD